MDDGILHATDRHVNNEHADEWCYSALVTECMCWLSNKRPSVTSTNCQRFDTVHCLTSIHATVELGKFIMQITCNALSFHCIVSRQSSQTNNEKKLKL